MPRTTLLCLGLILLATTAAGEPPTIHCPASPPTVLRLALQERWRVDATSDEAPLLGYIGAGSVATHDGRLYLLDTPLHHVLVYSDDGVLLDTIVREGDGPGEVRRPRSLQILPDGTIAILHGLPCRLALVDPQGRPRGEWLPDAFAGAARLVHTEIGWFGAYEAVDFSFPGPGQRNVFTLARHDAQGHVVERHVEAVRILDDRPRPPDEAAAYLPWSTWTATPDGQLILGRDRDAYRLEWLDPAGNVVRVVERDYPAYRRTEADLAKVRQRYLPPGSTENGTVAGSFCTHEPVLRQLQRLDDGCLHVRTSLSTRDLPAGVIYRYELHEPDGRLRAQVQILDPTDDFDPELDELVVLGHDRAVVLRNLHPAFRAAEAQGLPADLRGALSQDREDTEMGIVVCGLVVVP